MTISRVVEVYDYVDPNVTMLARMYERRLRGYADMGYKITDGLPEQPRLIWVGQQHTVDLLSYDIIDL